MPTNKHPELSTTDGSISKTLNDNMEKINEMYSNRSVSVFDMKQFIRDLVMNINDKTLAKKSEATRRFLLSLDQQRSKTDITFLVYNTVLAGDNCGVI